MADGDQIEAAPSPRRRTKWFRWVVPVVAAGSLATAWVVTRPQEEPEYWCAGVGLVTATRGFTPDEAMDACVREQGGDPEGWERIDQDDAGRTSYAYQPRHAAAVPQGLERVSVVGSPSYYQASGACVGADTP